MEIVIGSFLSLIIIARTFGLYNVTKAEYGSLSVILLISSKIADHLGEKMPNKEKVDRILLFSGSLDILFVLSYFMFLSEISLVYILVLYGFMALNKFIAAKFINHQLKANT
ncbi:hypothetical protein [Alkalibacterium sp. 20]|uniref:hypothetical protein n=1 Tax=Alkalibacterium sp. 20 TaxID=1798803 RepID=UPI00090028E9|nr:hypothetical protein [Alkalibacterium sp. 20]OJF91201.1 hypothetical protein AX762_11195 [Alkalibacterium sp. 20]